MQRSLMLGRLLWLGMLIGRVGLALLGGVWRTRFGRMCVMPWDGWMCVGGFGDGGR